jgi:uncharacterized FlgJ-related protein
MTFFLVVFVKMVDPVIDKQISGIFSDRKFSNKIKKELISSTENFTDEKRLFYKDIIKKIYIKWKPLIEESIAEANQELNK